MTKIKLYRIDQQRHEIDCQFVLDRFKQLDDVKARQQRKHQNSRQPKIRKDKKRDDR